ncbi:hypothetical protein QF042_003789 [Pedobacter sp. W3I1]|uniref:sugar-binding domain-containing protein n=1 Tax=Pedobacter sp. W3I1 TaxID=3042291 RepID=UPI002783D60A|nr:sugar-binding domain-containing protein [Pedobacter sp. W3I1]MDQ0640224.1 hypothetical protein [Pedobacter sp. W3I1]
MKLNKILLLSTIVISLLNSCTEKHFADSEILLDGAWRVKTSDSIKYSTSAYEDSTWIEIDEQKPLDVQGFRDYDGIVWYRYHVVIPSSVKNKAVMKKISFHLGQIDDSDRFYLNGHLIGSNGELGLNPADSLKSFAQVSRVYEMDINDKRILWDRENTIAIRVVDFGGGLGMNSPAFITTSHIKLRNLLSTSFNTKWKFIMADSINFSREDYDDKKWTIIDAGQEWETAGFPDYDGYAWYRQCFDVPKSLTKYFTDQTVLEFNLGKIDDYDQVYLNGQLIGENNKDIHSLKQDLNNNFKKGNSWANTPRRYRISVDDPRFHRHSSNLIAIRVFDSGGGGGMIERPGSVKIVSPDEQLLLDYSKFLSINKANKLDTVVLIKNRASSSFTGSVSYSFWKKKTKELFAVGASRIVLKPMDSTWFRISVPQTLDELHFSFKVSDAKDAVLISERKNIPFVLKN